MAKSKEKIDKDALYLKEREASIKLEHDQAGQFDKLLTLLSSGAFSLSILFINSKTDLEPCSKKILGFAWLFIFLCLFSTLSSFLLSQTCTRFYRTHLLNHDFVYDEDNLKKYNFKMDLVTYCNYASFAFLILGSIFLGVFVYSNI